MHLETGTTVFRHRAGCLSLWQTTMQVAMQQHLPQTQKPLSLRWPSTWEQVSQPVIVAPCRRSLSDTRFLVCDAHDIELTSHVSKRYTSNASAAKMTKWIGFYKAHRQTLIQPIVHIRRPDMQGWDGWVHVNPLGFGNTERRRGCHQNGDRVCSDVMSNEVAVAMIFNPTDTELATVNISIPVYYAGLETTALVSVDDSTPITLSVSRDYHISVQITMPPRSAHTVVFAKP